MKKIFLLIVCAFLLTGCVREIDKVDYEKYLIDTYGNLNFEYVSNESCNWFELGSCTYYFTTPELNGDKFPITGSFGVGDEKIFEDEYMKFKY